MIRCIHGFLLIDCWVCQDKKEVPDEMSHDHEADFHHWGGGVEHHATLEERVDHLEDRMHRLEKEMKEAMADIDTLNGILAGIQNDASSLSDDFKNLEAELQAAQEAANTNQPVDLTNSILMARNAQAALDAIVASAASSGPAPSPAPAPPPPPPPPAALSVSPAEVTGTAGTAVTGVISVSGGVEPYSFSSSLADITVDPTGVVAGTPAAAETGTIDVSDSSTPPLTASVPVTIS